jgi:hypothetical protein
MTGVNCYRLVPDDGPDLSDSSDDGNKRDVEPNIYRPGCSHGDAQLGGLESFVLRKASRRGLSTLSGTQPGTAGIVSKAPWTEPTLLFASANREDCRELRIR